MSRLFVAELQRLTGRRLVRLTAGLIALGIIVGGVVAFLETDSLSDAAYQQRVDETHQRNEQAQQQTIDCLRANGIDVQNAKGEIPDAIARVCLRGSRQTAADPRFHRTRLKGLLQGVTGGMAIVAWTLGASLVGAEFASRGMTTVLTFEPRRARVLLAKAAAATFACTLLVFLTLVGFAGALVPALTLHGASLRPGDPSVAAIAGIIGRGTALAALSAALGFSIAAIGRNTAAALGAGFGYIIIFENIIGSAYRSTRRWLLLGNVIVFVAGKSDGSDVPGRTVTEAALIITLVAATFLLAAVASFRIRDIA